MQMVEKKIKNNAYRSNEKSLCKDIVARDIENQRNFDSKEIFLKAQKIDLARQLLDEQIMANREYRNAPELEEKEYALNANKIKGIIEKY